MLERLFHDLVTLFVVVNPIGVIPLFVAVAGHESAAPATADKRTLASAPARLCRRNPDGRAPWSCRARSRPRGRAHAGCLPGAGTLRARTPPHPAGSLRSRRASAPRPAVIGGQRRYTSGIASRTASARLRLSRPRTRSSSSSSSANKVVVTVFLSRGPSAASLLQWQPAQHSSSSALTLSPSRSAGEGTPFAGVTVR